MARPEIVVLLAALSVGGCRDTRASNSNGPAAVTVRLTALYPVGEPASLRTDEEARVEAVSSHAGRLHLVASDAMEERRLGAFDVESALPATLTISGHLLPTGRISLVAVVDTASGEARSSRIALEVIDVDSDGDGVPASSDCNDRDPSQHAGATEICNGADDDCDAATDEECSACRPASEGACYSATLGLDDPSRDRGACHAGMRHCREDGTWGPCEGEQLPRPEACVSAVDDLDCDGLAGCADPGCQGPGEACAPVKDCEAEGCSDPDCAGEICRLPGDERGRCIDGTCAAAEVACDDGADDDGDALVDCADANCENKRCGPERVCRAAQCRPSRETDCDNATDDDGDGAADCADLDCPTDTSCGENRVCRAGTCRPASEQVCADGVDDDGDGLTDCADSDDCAEGGSCGPNRICRAAVCDDISESRCDNGVDDDGDAATDCEDVDCDGRLCAEPPQDENWSSGARRCAQQACAVPQSCNCATSCCSQTFPTCVDPPPPGEPITDGDPGRSCFACCPP